MYDHTLYVQNVKDLVRLIQAIACHPYDLILF